MISFIKKNSSWIIPGLVILILVIIIIIGINPSSHNTKKKGSQREINTITIKKDNKKEENKNDSKIYYPSITDVIYNFESGSTLKEKDILNISVKVTSNNELTHIEGALVPKESIPIKDATINLEFTYNKETDYYDASIPINENIYPCIWKLWYIRAYDINNNYGEYKNDEYEITVEETEKDITPPLVTDIKYSIENNSILSSGDSLEITLNTSDESAIKEITAVFLPTEQISLDKASIDITFTPLEDTTYNAILNITDDTPETSWYLWYIKLTDEYGNFTEIKDQDFKFSIIKK